MKEMGVLRDLGNSALEKGEDKGAPGMGRKLY